MHLFFFGSSKSRHLREKKDGDTSPSSPLQGTRGMQAIFQPFLCANAEHWWGVMQGLQANRQGNTNLLLTGHHATNKTGKFGSLEVQRKQACAQNFQGEGKTQILGSAQAHGESML